MEIQLAREYQALHGRDIDALVTPWAAEGLEAAGFTQSQVLTHVQPSNTAWPVALTLGSPEARTGSFTFVRARRVWIYEAVPVRVGPAVWLAVLSAEPRPDLAHTRWVLWLIERDDDGVARIETPLDMPDGDIAMWDSVSTSLRVEGGGFRIEVGFAHSGGGDPCDRVFRFDVDVRPGPTLVRTGMERDIQPCR